MKKTAAFTLALTLAFSLCTARAADFEDFTDKDAIQYQEAVSVLNRLGIITGYADQTFRPLDGLSRGAAAKIIVSLLLGSDAVKSLPVTESPYPDVPDTHTFSAVISRCKASGIISGYDDGSFRPGGSLTGYAFAKMLLGALGYDSVTEGFTGEGWTQNVARVGKNAGLFRDVDFAGNAAINRQTACQLALNALKAFRVEYSSKTPPA